MYGGRLPRRPAQLGRSWLKLHGATLLVEDPLESSIFEIGESRVPLARRDDEEYGWYFEDKQRSQRWPEPAKRGSYS